MEKIFTIVDEKRGIVQVTTDDERFYIREGKDEITGLPKHIYLPSASWIAGYTPKGIGYYRWLAEHGWDESQAIMRDRGKYGTRVHKAIEALLTGNTVAMETTFTDPYTGEQQALTYEEYNAIFSFSKWWKELNAAHKVEVVETEYTIWNEKEGYAGTIDCILLIDDEHWVLDWKTSKNIYESHKAQLSAYKHAVDFDAKIAILQIGYDRNKNGYKFTEIEDSYTSFLAAKVFWASEHDGSKPKQIEMPLSISLVEKEVKTKKKKK